MGKGRKNNKIVTKQQSGASASPPSPPAATVVKQAVDPITSAESEIKQLQSDAIAQATEQDLEAAASAAPLSFGPESASNQERIEKVIAAAQEARALFRAQERRAKEAEEAANEKRTQAERDLAEMTSSRERLKQAGIELETKIRKVVDDESRWRNDFAAVSKDKALLEQREADLQRREIEASAGFAAQQREAIKNLEIEAQGLHEDLSRLRKQITAERAEWDNERHSAEKEHTEKLRQEQARFEETLRAMEEDQRKRFSEGQKKLDEQLAELQAKEAALKKALRNVEWEGKEVAAQRADLASRVEQRLAAEREKLEFTCKSIQERLDEARKERDRLNTELERLRQTDRLHGHRTREDMAQEIETLKQDRDGLLTQLETRLDANAVARLQRLEAERDQWETDKLQLMQENQELKRDVARCRIAVTEIETLRDQKSALESSNALLHGTLESLRKDVDERVRIAASISVFPECSNMDTASAFQNAPPARREKLSALGAFVEEIRRRMALEPEPDERRYYRTEDIRCFLAGLAASRLLLLQGISGTGKTSLPVAFARALGGEVRVIPVQAGWRDKHDLIGHYNSFERKYHESELLRALYAAQTPRHEDTIFLIVLDEMNLSHPEHYFADFLSALEQQRPELQDIELAASLDPPLPKLLRDGRRIRLPKNVWFIGTANHDETTKDFAPKTYDRAHVMELPRKPEIFKPEPLVPLLPLTFGALDAAFRDAMRKHQNEAKRAYGFLAEKLGQTLRDRFRIGWGNRLERQMDAFVPVMIAADGTIGEATDHVLATKLLRTIKDKHGLQQDDLIALRGRLETDWKQLDSKRGPEQSMMLIQDELNRLGHVKEGA